jgi:hypothetical protein
MHCKTHDTDRLKRAVRLNNIQKLSPYRKENTALHSYKDRLVNAV